MRALNIKVKGTPGLIEPVYDPYKDGLDNVLDNNIDDTVGSIIDTNLYLLKQATSATQPGTLFDVLLPSGLFSEAASGGDKNSSFFAKRSLLPMLPSIIVPREPSNPLLRPSSNYSKLRKEKPRMPITSQGLRDSGYIIDQFGSQGAFVVSKSNVDNTESFWRN